MPDTTPPQGSLEARLQNIPATLDEFRDAASAIAAHHGAERKALDPTDEERRWLLDARERVLELRGKLAACIQVLNGGNRSERRRADATARKLVRQIQALDVRIKRGLEAIEARSTTPA